MRWPWKHSEAEKDLEEELRFHLERQVAENMTRGMDPAEARRQARMALDGVEASKEACRDVRPSASLTRLAKDFGYAVRGLRRSPLFAVSATATLAPWAWGQPQPFSASPTPCCCGGCLTAMRTV